jgi:hypothetical protein
MRGKTIGLALAAALLNLAAQPALANKPTPPAKPKAPVVKTQAPKVQAPKTQAPKIQTPKLQGPKIQAPKTQAPKVHAAKVQMPKAQAPKVKVPKTQASRTVKSSPSASKTPAKIKSTGPTGSTLPVFSRTWPPTNAVAQKLSTKPNMIERARAVLPPGTDLNLATAGFKNYGQFVAAVNNAQNHGLDFARLKALMTGINLDGTRTGQPTLSLGQAKQRLQTTTSMTPTNPRR